MPDEAFYCLHSEICKSLASPKRQQILGTLRDNEMSVSELVDATGMSQSNISRHLAILRNRGIVRVRRQGAYAYYSITDPKIIQAFDLITEVMQTTLEDQRDAATPDPGGSPAPDARLVPDA